MKSEIKKTGRLLYSTGGFCSAAGVTALQTLAEDNESYEDHMMLFSVDGNPRFRKDSEEQAMKLHGFESLEHLDDFILDWRINTVDVDALRQRYSDTPIEEIFVFAESSGIRFDALKSVFKGAKIVVYEEGMLGYCAGLFQNSHTGGLSSIDSFVSTNYFNLLEPQSLKGQKISLKKFDCSQLLENLRFLDTECSKIEPATEPSAFVCAAPLWRFGNVTFEEARDEHVKLIEILLASGLLVYFKDHPRPQMKLLPTIREQLDDADNLKIVDVSELSSVAEVAIEHLKPSIVVGFGSTALFNSYEFFGIPSFYYRTELVPASLNYTPQHVINAALKMRYIPNLKTIQNLDAAQETLESYNELTTKIFERNLTYRKPSLQDPIVQRVDCRLYKDYWPKPKTPSQVLDYIFLDDYLVETRNKAVAEIISKKKSDQMAG